MDIGKRLQEIRICKHISIYRLSQKSEVSESHIRNLESGKKSATVTTLEMLVHSMDMTLSEFFNEDDRCTYLTKREKRLLQCYRALPDETAEALTKFCETLSHTGLLNKKQYDALSALFSTRSVKVCDIMVCAVMESDFKQIALSFIL